jgi:cell division topological specificity factor
MSFFTKKRSALSAKERLQLVLVHDRTDLTPGELDALRDELLEVIARHIEIEPSEVQIDLEKNGREQRLVADIPLKGVARRRNG